MKTYTFIMGSTYDIQQTENSHKLVEEAQAQTIEVKKQAKLSKLAIAISILSFIVSAVALTR